MSLVTHCILLYMTLLVVYTNASVWWKKVELVLTTLHTASIGLGSLVQWFHMWASGLSKGSQETSKGEINPATQMCISFGDFSFNLAFLVKCWIMTEIFKENHL